MRRLWIVIPILVCGCHHEPSIVGNWLFYKMDGNTRDGTPITETETFTFRPDGTYTELGTTVDNKKVLRYRGEQSGKYTFDGKTLSLKETFCEFDTYNADGSLRSYRNPKLSDMTGAVSFVGNHLVMGDPNSMTSDTPVLTRQ